jgi:hypothetical protein
MTPQRRHNILAIASLLTLGATVYVSLDEEPATAEAATRVEIHRPAAPEPWNRPSLPPAEWNPFELPEPEAPAPTQAREVHQTPKPPPLHITYLGKWSDEGQVTVFVSDGVRNYAVKQGDEIGQDYRVERIAPPVMEVTYLPMKTRQIMQIGDVE